jgi:probable F420-dependent oxidoreductase
MGTDWYDSTATLGWLAGITSRVRLLSHVMVVAHRHPLRTAKELATLDVLSGGRLIIGAGAGHVPEEYRTIAGDFDRRGAETDEALSALAVALVDEFPTLPGTRWPAEGLGVAPRPVQQPRPPIWIGGSTRPALRRAARYGDGWLPQGTPRAQMPGQIAELRRWRDELRGGAPLDIGMVVEPIYLTGPGTGVHDGWDLAPTVLTGGPDEVTASLRQVAQMGVNHLLVRFMARGATELCDQIAAFGELVGPSIDG